MGFGVGAGVGEGELAVVDAAVESRVVVWVLRGRPFGFGLGAGVM